MDPGICQEIRSKTKKNIKSDRFITAQILTCHNLKALVRQYGIHNVKPRHIPRCVCVLDAASGLLVTRHNMQDSYTGMVHCNSVLCVVRCTPVSYIISCTGNRLKLQLFSDFTPPVPLPVNSIRRKCNNILLIKSNCTPGGTY